MSILEFSLPAYLPLLHPQRLRELITKEKLKKGAGRLRKAYFNPNCITIAVEDTLPRPLDTPKMIPFEGHSHVPYCRGRLKAPHCLPCPEPP